MLKRNVSSISLDQREVTRLRVLEHIRTKGAISRIDIASELQTSPATVTAATADLISAGMIKETESDGTARASKRGRPRVLLQLDGNFSLVAGLKVARHKISVLLVDFAGAEITSFEHPLTNPCMDPHTFTETVRKSVEGACASIGRSIDDMAGISIGIAGLVDAERNFVHWSSSLTDRNVDFGPLLSGHLPCPAFVENDTNLIAKAEQLFGLGKELKNFLVITVEHGVGMGIVLDGKLHRGERGCGAEFGHTKVQLEGALCQCGQRGCLEAYVGDYALIREANIAGHGNEVQSVADVYANAKSGDARSVSVLDRAGKMFAMGVSNLINLFDPELIILSGAQMKFDYLSSPEVMTRIRQGVADVDAPLPEIKVHHWGDTLFTKGAAAYGIEQVSILKVKELASHAD